MPTLPDHPGDTQRVELLGRNRLIDELLRDNLEVALPIRDRGIDLIAYADLGDDLRAYTARPIQMKASWTRAFGIYRKYAKFPDLLIAYVWHLNDRNKAVTFALTYAEALRVAEQMRWTKTESWARGGYSTSRPSAELNDLLKPFEMTPGAWRELLLKKKTPSV